MSEWHVFGYEVSDAPNAPPHLMVFEAVVVGERKLRVVLDRDDRHGIFAESAADTLAAAARELDPTATFTARLQKQFAPEGLPAVDGTKFAVLLSSAPNRARGGA